jgi:hypothetical protein
MKGLKLGAKQNDYIGGSLRAGLGKSQDRAKSDDEQKKRKKKALSAIGKGLGKMGGGFGSTDREEYKDSYSKPDMKPIMMIIGKRG